MSQIGAELRFSLCAGITATALLLGLGASAEPEPGPLLVVDRVVDGEWAVLEGPDLETFDVPVRFLPEGTGEGDEVRIGRVR